MSRSLARRALAYTVAASLVSLVVAFGLFWTARSNYAISQRTDQLSRQTVAIASGLQAEDKLLVSAGMKRLQEQLFRVQSRLIGAALFVTDANGNVLRSSGQVELNTLPIDTLGAANAGGAKTGVRLASNDLLILLAAAPTGDGGEYLVAVQPLRDVLVPWEQLTGVIDDLRSRGVVLEDYDLPEMGLKTVNGVVEMEDAKAAWFKDTEGNIISVATM